MATKKKTANKDEIKLITKINNFPQLLAYMLRYKKMKEVLFFIVIVLLIVIMALCLSCDEKNGIQWRPAIDIEKVVGK